MSEDAISNRRRDLITRLNRLERHLYIKQLRILTIIWHFINILQIDVSTGHFPVLLKIFLIKQQSHYIREL